MLKDVAIITVATIVDFPYFFEKRANKNFNQYGEIVDMAAKLSFEVSKINFLENSHLESTMIFNRFV